MLATYLMFETLINTYAPIQKLVKAKLKLKAKFWLTKGIMTSVKKKIVIYQKFIKAKNLAGKKNILYNNFKCYRNLISELSRISKAKHDHHYFTDHKRDMLKTCERIKSLININKRENENVTCLIVHGTEEIDQFLISNPFNTFFSTIVKKIRKIVKTNKHFSVFLTGPLKSNFFLTTTLPDEIQEVIKSLNHKKASNIPTKILMIFDKIICIPLAISLSFECGVFSMSLNVNSFSFCLRWFQ